MKDLLKIFEELDLAKILANAKDILPFVALGLLVLIWIVLLVRHVRYRRKK